jgi:hypothetical protein
MLDYATTLHPELKPGVDYRISNPQQFREWRRLLQPICRTIALTAIEGADEWWFAGDEAPKNHHSVYSTAATCVKNGVVQNVVTNFSVVKDGLAVTEGQTIVDHLKVTHNGGMQVKMWKCKGGIGDNAPNAQAANRYAIEQGIKQMKEDPSWLTLDTNQQETCLKMVAMRCANHGTHKVCEASTQFETKLPGY